MSVSIRDLIARKRDGGRVEEAEWNAFVAAITAGAVPDYQIAAFLMAIYLRGLDQRETADLTEALAASGERLFFNDPTYVDKHSTGGVGDAVTLVAVPWVAACGVHVPKLSGRGLGHTGGTIDKLSSIPGINLALTAGQLERITRDVGWAASEARGLAPADKVLYELRDATATVDSIPLITASILSKKFAGGAPSLVFEVTSGAGAFVGDAETARELARNLVAASRARGRNAAAVLVSMDQPLGRAVGNALEIREALVTLGGSGPADLLAASREVTSVMFRMAFPKRERDADGVIDDALASGAARRKFDAMAVAQGAPPDWERLLPEASNRETIASAEDGVIRRLDAYAVARAAGALGANREYKEDVIDAAAGVVLNKKQGEAVRAGETLMTLHYNDGEKLDAAKEWARQAVTVADGGEAPPVILGVIE